MGELFQIVRQQVGQRSVGWQPGKAEIGHFSDPQRETLRSAASWSIDEGSAADRGHHRRPDRPSRCQGRPAWRRTPDQQIGLLGLIGTTLFMRSRDAKNYFAVD